MPLVSIIMATYNGLRIGVLGDSINALLRSRFGDFELIIVDNGSSDGSWDFLNRLAQDDPRIKILRLDRNLGYSPANNFAVNYARGEYLAFLHNDSRVQPDWLDNMLPFLERNEKIGVVQPQIRDMSNPSVIISEGNSIDRLGFMLVQEFGERVGRAKDPHPVLSATAACMVFRRAAFEAAGGFDEGYFFSHDEIDLCWRTWLAGFEVYCVPSAVAWHRASTTVDRFFGAEVSYLNSRNRLTSLIKNYGSLSLVVYVIPSLLSAMLVMMSRVSQKDAHGGVATLKGTLKAIVNLPTTLLKRRRIQETRKIKDSQLMARGLITPIVPSRLARRFGSR